MEGHSRNFSDAAIADAPASEREGERPFNGSAGRQQTVIGPIASRKNAGRVYAPAFFLEEAPSS